MKIQDALARYLEILDRRDSDENEFAAGGTTYTQDQLAKALDDLRNASPDVPDTRYNGWTNYETWNVKLWMDNDQGSYHGGQDAAQTAWDEAEAERSFTREERATLDLADSLKESYEDAMADILEGAHQSASVWADLLGAALSEVNWYEIAEHMIADVDREAEEAEEEADAE
jgi:hypothetical protein